MNDKEFIEQLTMEWLEEDPSGHQGVKIGIPVQHQTRDGREAVRWPLMSRDFRNMPSIYSDRVIKKDSLAFSLLEAALGEDLTPELGFTDIIARAKGKQVIVLVEKARNAKTGENYYKVTGVYNYDEYRHLLDKEVQNIDRFNDLIQVGQ